jgi:hypothetical protein
MAGTTLSWKTTNVLLGAGQIFANVAIPGAGARLTLDATTKTPDSTANPSAIHLGATQEGSKAMIKSTWEEFFVDEFAAPIQTNITQIEASLSGNFVGVMDTALMELLTPGMGTKTTGSGYEQLTFGSRAVVYPSIVIIAPLIEDSTKVMVFQLYKALNQAGVEFDVGRKKLAFTPFNFKGYEITSRAAADTLCSLWKQVT